MAITAAFRLKSFLALAVGGVVLLSLAWSWLGQAYVSLLLQTVSPLLPTSVDLEQHGHEIQFFARLAQSEARAPVQAGIHGMMMSYGLILATAVLLAMPGLSLRVRLPLILLAVLTAFLAHAVGLYMLVQRLDSVAHHLSTPKDFTSLAGTLTYAWLFIPSLAWLPLLLSQWWPLRGARLADVVGSKA